MAEQLNPRDEMYKAVNALDSHTKKISNGGKIHVRNNSMVTDSVISLASVASNLSNAKLIELITIIANQCYVAGYHDGKTSVETLIGKG